MFIHKAIIMHIFGIGGGKVLKKASIITLITTILMLLALILACTFMPVSDQAHAAANVWSVRVAKVTTDGETTQYTDLSSGERMTESVSLSFLISYPNPDNYINNDFFYYYESNVKLYPDDYTNITSWLEMKNMSSITVPFQGNQVEYKAFNYDPLGAASECNKYIYFKRTYTNNEGMAVEQIYSYSWNIIINLLLQEEDLGIDDIVATHQSSSGSMVSYTGAWINTSLRFVITTNWMNINNKDFDTSDELLFYSIDEKPAHDVNKEWIAMSNNVLTLYDSLESRVFFKVTNISQSLSSIHEFEYQVNLDRTTPTFDVSAVTKNIDGDEVPYRNTLWTSNSVYFTITPTKQANEKDYSPITYYFRTNTQPNYEVYNSSVPYPCLSSVAGLKFKAVNAAGTSEESEEFEVNIDNIRPVASLTVLTEDPLDSNATKPLTQSRIPVTLIDEDSFNDALITYETLYYLSSNNYIAISNFIPGVSQYYYSDNKYYANDKVFFNVYNRGVGGNIIPNESPLTYYYSVKIGDGEYSSPSTLKSFGWDSNNNKFFSMQDSILSGISSNRSYRFWIQSDAGLISEMVEFNAVLVDDYFTIEVEEISYSANAQGWASTPIPVYVTVPTDTRVIKDSNDNITGYTEPTTKYIFYYAPVEISNVLYSAEGFCVENIDNGRSIYRFYLSASANSAFIVYAKNMAGKPSNNTYQSEDKIMIDTTLPVAWIEAFVQDEDTQGPTLIEAPSGTWVSGSIYLTLKAEIGISSIYAYRLHYVPDAFGKPIRDNETGKIIWLDNSSVIAQDEAIEGVAYYHQEIRLPNESTIKMTEYYCYRIYTGSGVYIDIEYIANLVDPQAAIELDSIAILDTDSYDPNDEGVEVQLLNGNRMVIKESFEKKSFSEDFYIKLFSDSVHLGLFEYQKYNWTTGEYEDVVSYDDYIRVSIPINKRKSENVIRIKLVSKAVNYKSEFKTSVGYYDIVYDYNTLNITIDYSANATASPDTNWKNGTLNVSVSLQTSEGGNDKELTLEDKENYTYYYMLINYYGFISENDALKNGKWIPQDEGEYDILNKYNFVIPFENISFYGYIALSVCNEADYRSSSSGFITNIIRIDNTVPDLTKMINQTSGDSSNNPYDYTYTYFSKDAITLRNFLYNDRSTITYYYYEIPPSEFVPEENPVSTTDTKGWTHLSSNKIFGPVEGTNYKTYKVLLYAINELGKEAGGIPEQEQDSYYTYEFIIDTSALNGELSYSPSDRGYKDSATGLWSYKWEDEAVIYLSSDNSNTQVSFHYSIDKGSTWQVYREDDPYYNVGTNERIVFDTNIFPSGVMGTFSFKVRNRAGTEYLYREDIYIAMDNNAPDFEIILTVNGAEYNGGSTEFTDNTGEWSSVDINIGINLTLANVSGARFTYKIYYFRDGTMKSAEEALPVPNPSRFSSYTILSDSTLFPNRSGDIVLEIIATNKKKTDLFTSHSVRMRIDKTVPEFDLEGIASSSDSATGVHVDSGQWTNHTKVVISRENAAKNASNVKYFLTYEDLTSTSKEQYEWDASNSSRECTQTCTITVDAVCESGLEYTRIFQVNIDTIAPIINFMGGVNVVPGEKHYIDLKVVISEENIKICQYITIKGEKNGYNIVPSGQIISTSSVNNSTRYDSSIESDNIEDTEYRGYVEIIVEDYAGNSATLSFYMVPFDLTVNNITLSNEDKRSLEGYEDDLNKARIYMESSRVTYFENLIQRLKDRIHTLEQEIDGYRKYLENLSQRISYELKSDYDEMFKYRETYNNYKLFGQGWIQDAITGDKSSKYFAYYENFISVFETLAAEMAEVFEVEDATMKLPAINVVETVDYNDVIAVYNQYNSLTVDQRDCFTTTLYTKILELKKKCEVLLLTDVQSGISIDGNIAPGAQINISNIKPTDEFYANAQDSIMSMLTPNDPRAIVSINRISLAEPYSQSVTGKMKIKLPIPEEWQPYIKFAVYKVTIDGTVSAIENVQIQGDGKSLIFESTELSTFVLCAKANIQGTQSTDDVFGTVLGLELDIKMIRNLTIIGAFLFGLVLIVVVITGIRRKKFLNSYNKAYRARRYRSGIQQIPYGNTYPKTNPLKQEERVITPKHPF